MSHYGVILVEYSCLRPTTHLNCPLKAYIALGTPLQLYSHVVIVRQPFKLPIGLILAMLPQGALLGHYGVMLAEKSCPGQITQLHCPL